MQRESNRVIRELWNLVKNALNDIMPNAVKEEDYPQQNEIEQNQNYSEEKQEQEKEEGQENEIHEDLDNQEQNEEQPHQEEGGEGGEGGAEE